MQNRQKKRAKKISQRVVFFCFFFFLSRSINVFNCTTVDKADWILSIIVGVVKTHN